MLPPCNITITPIERELVVVESKVADMQVDGQKGRGSIPDPGPIVRLGPFEGAGIKKIEHLQSGF